MIHFATLTTHTFGHPHFHIFKSHPQIWLITPMRFLTNISHHPKVPNFLCKTLICHKCYQHHQPHHAWTTGTTRITSKSEVPNQEPLSPIHCGNTKWSCGICLIKNCLIVGFVWTNLGKMLIQMDNSCGHRSHYPSFRSWKICPTLCHFLLGKRSDKCQKKLSADIEPQTAI